MRNAGIGSWLRRRERATPDHVAVIDATTGGARTYREVAARSYRVADVLGSTGVGAGDRVAFLGRNSAEFLEVMLGATAIGAIFVPLNWRLTAPELAYILDDCSPSAVVHDASLSDLATESLDASGHAPAAVASLGTSWEGRLAAADPTWLDVPVSLDDPAVIVYTSGTTGRPKGAVLSHANITWNAMSVLLGTGLGDDDVTLVCAPMFHVAGLNMVATPSFLAGGAVVVMGAFAPGEVLELIERHRVTVMFGVPAMFNAIADHPDFHSADLSSMRRVLCGGATVPLATIRTWHERGIPMLQGYGMTEVAPGAALLSAEMAERKAGTTGVPMFFTDVEVRRVDGSQVAPGEPGEVVVSGPNVMLGYWNNDDATAEAVRDGWFHTGDVAVVDEDGYVTIVDRVKDMYISGGENVYPAEVENALFEHPDVADCAVVGVPDDRWGEVGMAAIVARPGTSPTAEHLRAFLDGRIARYKIPAYYRLVDVLPRTGAGKVRKPELRGDLLAGSITESES